ncbi:MAG: DNA adenine methylase [Deltaproteobacteria bacterium]|nr:DNA adenine methylase [Deltaproteobacteria bacterium]
MPAVRSSGRKRARPKQAALSLGAATEKPDYARPFIKWAGGKTQLLPQLARFYPPKGSVERYIEPFLGSGAVFFHVKAMVEPRHVLLWDNNRELVDTFKAVQEDVDRVIKLLARYRARHSKEFFLGMREKRPKSRAGKAARLIYLNKTCFNGLYRVNSRGIFNVPFGRHENPKLFNETWLRQAARALAEARIEAEDFRLLESEARAGDFIYFDPPYHPLSKTSYFTAYTRDLFGQAEQEKLAALCRALDRKGCLLMLSNSDTPLVRRLYKDFEIREVSARRSINSKAERRGAIYELVVLNDRLLEASRGRI